MPRNWTLLSKSRSGLNRRSTARAPTVTRFWSTGTQMKLSSCLDTSPRLAARFSSVEVEQGAFTGSMTEIAAAINYYLNGHGNKMTLDVSMIDEADADLNFFDVYTGIQPLPGIEDNAILIRFQWQLAL